MAKTSKEKCKCFYCGKEYVETNYYKSSSNFYGNIGKVPFCKQCIGKFYEYYCEKYTNEGCLTPEKKAVKRLCMAFDIYFNEKAFDDAVNNAKKREKNISALGAYINMIQLSQFKGKSYEDTISDEEKEDFIASVPSNTFDSVDIDEKTINFFGAGFSNDDYKFLRREYGDWTTRHEWNTKAQEEVFKRLCFKQLEILKATQRGEDTKNLDDTFQKLLDTAKLQPKQNSGETISDAQTFGTLIDKWENERPLPEIDEELRDVDKIGLYLDVFFKGHLAKMMGMKNGLSRLYGKYMKQYTVEKPEYENDEDNEALFDAIFGGSMLDTDSNDGDNEVI